MAQSVRRNNLHFVFAKETRRLRPTALEIDDWITQIFLVAALLNTVSAAPQFNPREATIVLLENNFNGMDPWHWRYETSNGIRQEQFGTEGDGARLRGSFSWQPPDEGGATYSVSYEADENGYRPRVSFGTAPAAMRPTLLRQPAGPGPETFGRGGLSTHTLSLLTSTIYTLVG